MGKCVSLSACALSQNRYTWASQTHLEKFRVNYRKIAQKGDSFERPENLIPEKGVHLTLESAYYVGLHRSKHVLKNFEKQRF